MNDTIIKASPDRLRMDQQMDQMNELAEANPDIYRHIFYWLNGAGGVNHELGNHLEEAVNYVKRTFPQ